jgi:hypothetical protein
MSNIPTAFATRKPVAYLDTVRLFFRGQLAADLRARIRAPIHSVHPKDYTFFEPCNPNDKFRGWTLALSHCPSLDALRVLIELQDKLHATLSRFDVAVDFIAETYPDARDLMDSLLLIAVLRNGRGQIERVKETIYLNPLRTRGKNARLYSDLPSKIEIDQPCYHFELMFLGAQTCKRTAGFDTVRDLLNIDPHQLFDTHIRLIDNVPARWRYAQNFFKQNRRKRFAPIPMSALRLPRQLSFPSTAQIDANHALHRMITAQIYTYPPPPTANKANIHRHNFTTRPSLFIFSDGTTTHFSDHHPNPLLKPPRIRLSIPRKRVRLHSSEPMTS